MVIHSVKARTNINFGSLPGQLGSAVKRVAANPRKGAAKKIFGPIRRNSLSFLSLMRSFISMERFRQKGNTVASSDLKARLYFRDSITRLAILNRDLRANTHVQQEELIFQNSYARISYEIDQP